MPDASLNPTSLVVVGIGSAFALSSVLYIAWDISGGHVNPAVTFAMAVGGHISVPTALFYWVAQLIASVMACLVLRVIVVGMVFIFLCVYVYGLDMYILFTLFGFVYVFSACSNIHHCRRDDRVWSIGVRGYSDICFGVHSVCSQGP